jgi:hypothetical protein
MLCPCVQRQTNRLLHVDLTGATDLVHFHLFHADYDFCLFGTHSFFLCYMIANVLDNIWIRLLLGRCMSFDSGNETFCIYHGTVMNMHSHVCGTQCLLI